MFPRTSRVAALILLVCCGGCVEQLMSIKTNPPGALVYLNDQEVGRTPLTTDFIWYGNYQIELRKDGYDTIKTHKWVKAPWWNWVPMDLFANMSPGVYRDHQKLYYAMQPTTTATTNPTELIHRAEIFKKDLESSTHTRSATTRSSATKPTSKPTVRPSN